MSHSQTQTCYTHTTTAWDQSLLAALTHPTLSMKSPDRLERKGGGKKNASFLQPPPTLLFLQYPPLVVGYKVLLPWKCKRLCQHWLGWKWWKRPKDSPSADLPTLCLHFFPRLISQVGTSSSGVTPAVYSETVTYVRRSCMHHEDDSGGGKTGRWEG